MIDTTTVLTNARELIKEPGHWGQGTSNKRPPQCYCALEAIPYGTPLIAEHEVYAAEGALIKVLGLQGWASIVRWNDEPGRTQEEVLAAFDAAIALSKEVSNGTPAG